MNTKHLEYFIETAKHKSINEAASALYISQPSLSYALKSIEEELGFPLFHRSMTGIRLTTEGEKIRKETEQILVTMEKWKTLKASNIIKRVTLSSVGAVSDFAFPLLLSAYQQQYPEIEIRTDNSYLGLAFDMPITSQNRYTILFGFVAHNVLEAKRLIAKRNGWELMHIIDGKSFVLINGKHPLAQMEHVTLSDLNQFERIATDQAFFHSTHLPFADIYNLFDKAHFIGSPSREASIQLVVLNQDIITTASFLAVTNNEYIKSGQIKAIEIADYPMLSSLVVLYPSEASDYIIEMVDLAKDILVKNI